MVRVGAQVQVPLLPALRVSRVSISHGIVRFGLSPVIGWIPVPGFPNDNVISQGSYSGQHSASGAFSFVRPLVLQAQTSSADATLFKNPEGAIFCSKFTMATLAKTKGGVKDVQGVLGHSKTDTTVNVYMKPIETGVKQALNAIQGGKQGCV